MCHVSDVADSGSYGFSLGGGDWPLRAFVVEKNGRLQGYVNACPHAGRPLNWKPNGFLTRDKSMILCTAHGALFEIQTGLCVAGPCPGKSLRTVDVRVIDNRVQAREAN